MKRSKLIILLSSALVMNCGPCHINERIDRGRAEEHTKTIRGAQRAYYGQFNKYGTLIELAKEDLIPERLADSVDSNFRFEMTTHATGYVLRVTNPSAQQSKREELSLYLDESGVIRGTVNPDKQASATSDPLRVGEE